MIKLTEKYSITADENQYVLGVPYIGKNKDGEPVNMMRSTTYYTALAGAVKAALSKTLRQEVSNGEINTLHHFLERQKELQSEFEKLLEPLDI